MNKTMQTSALVLLMSASTISSASDEARQLVELPEKMQQHMMSNMHKAGTSMNKAASHFALKAQESELLPAYKVVSEVTAACVACHSGYRI